LELNVDCSAGGHLNVELQSADGQPLPAYTLADCDRIYRAVVKRSVQLIRLFLAGIGRQNQCETSEAELTTVTWCSFIRLSEFSFWFRA
jgi:hypothetical protein